MKKRQAKPDVRERFGFAVKSLRGEQGQTQEDLADKAGIHRTYLTDVEGGSLNLCLINIERLAAALGASSTCRSSRPATSTIGFASQCTPPSFYGPAAGCQPGSNRDKVFLSGFSQDCGLPSRRGKRLSKILLQPTLRRLIIMRTVLPRFTSQKGSPMASEGSVTGWLVRLQTGDPDAAQKLWDRYFQHLLGLARKKLKGRILHTADEQDVAASAFASFWQGVRGGRFSDLHDRDNLWGLLIRITTRKALDYVQYDHRKRRAHEDAGVAPDELPARELSPEEEAEVREQFERLLEMLRDPVLQSIALWKMEGFTNKEIAAKLSQVRRTHERTVERKLGRIRAIWLQEMDR
jgi:DNA-directed RNA polymerase specialized sigma24 family protein/transcriptional regulator with XRE-family HTH domain